jgi:hypothetical protein
MSFENYLQGGNNQFQNNVIFIVGRVTHVILGPYLADGKTRDPDFNDPTDIGGIKYAILNSPEYSSGMGDSNPIAKPAWPHLKQLPLLGEYVYIMPGPSVNLNEQGGAQDYYYLPPFGLWSSPHQNALPALNEVVEGVSMYELGIQEAALGTPTVSDIGNFVYPLGNSFPEKADIKALRPFVGDVTVEGRWGNSIRFGSSLKLNMEENNWAESKNDGDPIIIIRNGQGQQPNPEAWIPTTEDINLDKSSIYLTAGQSITIDELNGYPLNSFDLTVKQKPTVVKTLTQVPVTSEGLSPQFQDNKIASASQATPTQQSTNSNQPASGVAVDGEYYLDQVNNKYTVSLKVMIDGQIANTASKLDTVLATAYSKAVDELKSKNTDKVLIIPAIDQIRRL